MSQKLEALTFPPEPWTLTTFGIKNSPDKAAGMSTHPEKTASLFLLLQNLQAQIVTVEGALSVSRYCWFGDD